MSSADWRSVPPCPVKDEDGFVEFLDTVGICLWRPMGSPDFPNLADKMDLAKPDDIWNTWSWKDDLHEARRLFYGKLLAGRPTFVSMDFLPAVIAALGDIDPYTLHERGTLTSEAIRIYEVLSRKRELSTHDLRKEAGLESPAGRSAFERAVTSLCALFQICKTVTTGRTRETYGYRWGLLEDWVPDVLARAAALRPHDAARAVVERLSSFGVSMKPAQWRRLFGWDDETIAAAVGPDK